MVPDIHAIMKNAHNRDRILAQDEVQEKMPPAPAISRNVQQVQARGNVVTQS